MNDGLEKMQEEMASCKEGLHKDMESCQADVYADIKVLKEGYAELSLTLREREVSLREYNDEIHNKLNSVMVKFDDHTSEEMETINMIKDALVALSASVGTLTQSTESNADFIETFKKQWLKYTTIATTVAGTLGSIYWLYVFLQKNGVVFVIEKVG